MPRRNKNNNSSGNRQNYQRQDRSGYRKGNRNNSRERSSQQRNHHGNRSDRDNGDRNRNRQLSNPSYNYQHQPPHPFANLPLQQPPFPRAPVMVMVDPSTFPWNNINTPQQPGHFNNYPTSNNRSVQNSGNRQSRRQRPPMKSRGRSRVIGRMPNRQDKFKRSKKFNNQKNFASSHLQKPTLWTDAGLFKKVLKDYDNLSVDQFKSLSLDDQFSSFLKAHQLSSEEIAKRNLIVDELKAILRKYETYYSCELYPFGSHLTGLGDSTSDMDIYIDIYGDNGEILNRIGRKITEVVRDEVLQHLKNAYCARTGKHFVEKALPINNKAILIRMKHAETGIQCDLSFANRLSVKNTELLKFYMDFDPRVKPLLILLRAWARFHDIAGEQKLKMYAISLMALVFLMKEKILPSVHFLQKLKAVERETLGISINPDIVNGWNGSFCQNVRMIEQQFERDPFLRVNTQPDANEILKLAKGFFEMFGELDYDSAVICPLLGELLPRFEFQKDIPILPEPLSSLVLRKKITPGALKLQHCLCIQDPFVLDFNVGGVTKQNILSKFQNACKIAYNTLSDISQEGWSILDVFSGKRLHCKIETELGLKTEPENSDIKPDPVATTSSNMIAPVEKCEHMRFQLWLTVDSDSVFVELLAKRLAQAVVLVEMDKEEQEVRFRKLVATLWSEFGKTFITEFFTDGLKLDAQDNLDIPIDLLAEEIRKNRKDYRTKLVNVLEEEKGKLKKRSTRSEQAQAKELNENVMKKIDEFSNEPLVKSWIISVTYPFLEGRKQEGKVEYGPYNVNPIEVEGKLSDSVLQDFMVQGWTRNKPSENQEKVGLDEEPQAKRARMENWSEFKFKMDMRMEMDTDAKPVMLLAFQALAEPEGTSDDIEKSFRTLLRYTESAFLAFMMFKLTKWLKQNANE